MYATTSTRTMTISRTGMTPPPTNERMSGIGRVSLARIGCRGGGRRIRRGWRHGHGNRLWHEAFHDDAHAGRPDDLDRRAGRDVLLGGRGDLVVLALGPHVDGAETSGGDGDAD